MVLFFVVGVNGAEEVGEVNEVSKQEPAATERAEVTVPDQTENNEPDQTDKNEPDQTEDNEPDQTPVENYSWSE